MKRNDSNTGAFPPVRVICEYTRLVFEQCCAELVRDGYKLFSANALVRSDGDVAWTAVFELPCRKQKPQED